MVATATPICGHKHRWSEHSGGSGSSKPWHGPMAWPGLLNPPFRHHGEMLPSPEGRMQGSKDTASLSCNTVIMAVLHDLQTRQIQT